MNKTETATEYVDRVIADAHVSKQHPIPVLAEIIRELARRLDEIQK